MAQHLLIGNEGRSRQASHGDHLSDRDQHALHLARTLREQMLAWMFRRGVTATLVITPFVDSSGQPNVLVRMNSDLALAMILSFHEQRTRPSPRRRDNGTYGPTTP